MSLAKLFDAEYRGGRAASAAQTRKTPGGRRTIAEADATESATYTTTENCEPFMPHRRYTEVKLNELYPSFEVPKAVDADDPFTHAVDPILEHGKEEAQRIAQEAAEKGRRRYAEL